MKLNRIVYMLLFFVTCQGVVGKPDSSLYLSREKWEDIINKADYTENYRDKKKEPTETKKSDSSPSTPASQLYFNDLKYFFYGIVIVLVIFLIYKIAVNTKANPDVKEKVISFESMKEIEQNMHEIDLEDLLKDALLAKNYRVALRLNFLIIIKLLSQTGKINWAREKTNWEYYTELNDKLLADQFKNIINSFEIFWYGERPITEYDYALTEPAYKAMQQRLTPLIPHEQ